MSKKDRYEELNPRRKFIQKSLLASAAFLGVGAIESKLFGETSSPVSPSLFSPEPGGDSKFPIVVSTWNHGIAANEAAWKVLYTGGHALDAVEQGVRVPEADPNVTSVGYGGLPDRDGHVTLDACIMDERGRAGSVAFIESIMHPISVARMVMEKTPHVMLVGDGALQFALENGFKKQNLLTRSARKAWEEWMKANNYSPPVDKKDKKNKTDEPKIDKDNHDTIGMLAIDKNARICGACTTSGLAWKIHGRVGDSPIIGAGLFVDGDVGAACATGKGEAVIKICGSHLIVELMRQGKSPADACKEAVMRIVAKQEDYKDFQVGFLAINKKGEVGAYSLQTGFQYAMYVDGKNQLVSSPSI